WRLHLDDHLIGHREIAPSTATPFSSVKHMMPLTFIIFGASGDLTQRKLIPALYQLHRKNRLPTGTRIIGFSRTKFSHDEWRDQLAGSTREFVGEGFDEQAWKSFAPAIFYHP